MNLEQCIGGSLTNEAVEEVAYSARLGVSSFVPLARSCIENQPGRSLPSLPDLLEPDALRRWAQSKWYLVSRAALRVCSPWSLVSCTCRWFVWPQVFLPKATALRRACPGGGRSDGIDGFGICAVAQCHVWWSARSVQLSITPLWRLQGGTMR